MRPRPKDIRNTVNDNINTILCLFVFVLPALQAILHRHVVVVCHSFLFLFVSVVVLLLLVVVLFLLVFFWFCFHSFCTSFRLFVMK